MPETEHSFADRLQRGREIQAGIAGFSPAFAPADAELDPATFDAFLDGLDTLNTAVADAVADWTTDVASRSAKVVDIKARALRASSRVKSNSAWKMNVPAVKTAADNLRGYRTPKPKAPVDGPAPRPARRATRASRISRASPTSWWLL